MVLLMSGITRQNRAGVSGLVGPLALSMNFQRFDSTSSWTKPDDVKVVWIEAIGAGGKGGGGTGNATHNRGGAGGGGASFVWACFHADALPATLDVIIAATNTGGGAGGGADGGDGDNGGYSGVDMPSGHAEAGKVILASYGGG